MLPFLKRRDSGKPRLSKYISFKSVELLVHEELDTLLFSRTVLKLKDR